MLWRDPHIGGFLHGNVGRNEIRQQFHLVLVEIGTNVQDLICPCVLISAENSW